MIILADAILIPPRPPIPPTSIIKVRGLQKCTELNSVRIHFAPGVVLYSTTILCRIWTGLAWELKLEGLSALFSYFYLSFVRRFVSVFWDSNFLEFFRLIDSC